MGTVIYLKINKTKLERMYYHSIKKKELNCLCCTGDINKNFPRGLLEHPVFLIPIKDHYILFRKNKQTEIYSWVYIDR